MSMRPHRISRARRHGQAGFSLVELMIAMVAGLVVSSAVVAFLMSSFKGNSDYVQSTRLTQELRNSMDLVSRDLRRAGYDGKSIQYLAAGDISPLSRIQLCNDSDVCTVGATAPLTCAIYSYDRPNGTWGAVDLTGGEVRGIRRRARTVNGISVGVLEYAVSTNGVKPQCSGAGPNYSSVPTTCNTATGWCPLSDPSRIDITSFTLTNAGATTGEVQMRYINVVMQGRLAGNTEYVRGLRSSVRIRSECYDTIANCAASP